MLIKDDQGNYINLNCVEKLYIQTMGHDHVLVANTISKGPYFIMSDHDRNTVKDYLLSIVNMYNHGREANP